MKRSRTASAAPDRPLGEFDDRISDGTDVTAAGRIEPAQVGEIGDRVRQDLQVQDDGASPMAWRRAFRRRQQRARCGKAVFDVGHEDRVVPLR
jgi:hypothetical protein